MNETAIKTNKRILINLMKSIVIVVLSIAIVLFFPHVLNMLRFILAKNYHTDSVLFLGVGNGILNGQKVYTDLFELKTPLIFLTHALSLERFGDLTLITVLSFLSHITFYVIPMYICLRLEKDWLTKIILSLSALLLSFSLSNYMAWNASPGLPELFGSATTLLYVAVMFQWNKKEFAFSWKHIITSGLLIAISVMWKEPFLIICIAIALCFLKLNWSYFKVIILSFIFAGIASLLFLAASGNLSSYFTFYLPFIFSDRIIADSVLKQAFDFAKIHKYITTYAPFMSITVCVLFLTHLVPNKKDLKNIVTNTIKTFGILYFLSLSIAIGGFFPQHYIFPVSVLFALFFAAIEKIKNEYIIIIVLSIASLLLCYNTGTDSPVALKHERILEMQEAGAFNDEIVTSLGYDEFLYLQGGLDLCYPQKTKLIGPFFFQFNHWFKDKNSRWSKIMLEQIYKANVIVTADAGFELGMLQGYFNIYLKENFRKVDFASEFPEVTVPEKYMAVMYIRK